MRGRSRFKKRNTTCPFCGNQTCPRCRARMTQTSPAFLKAMEAVTDELFKFLNQQSPEMKMFNIVRRG